MDDIARLGLLITCVLAIVVGTRTLWIWLHTRKVAELMIGLNILGLSLGGVMITALYGVPLTSESFAPYSLGLFCFVLHIFALYVGTWKIFRPTEGWPLLLSIVAVAAAIAWAVMALTAPDTEQQRTILYSMLRFVGQMWSAFECFRYSEMLRRRVALGLAEPMVAHRIWLWAMGAVAQVAVLSLEVATWYLSGQMLIASSFGLHMTSLLGLAGTAAIALAFFPPAAYVRFVGAHFDGSLREETS